jgi:hypothetical protein
MGDRELSQPSRGEYGVWCAAGAVGGRETAWYVDLCPIAYYLYRPALVGPVDLPLVTGVGVDYLV